MSINKRLSDLYQENWNLLEVEASKISNVAQPLLLKVKDEDQYEKSDVKVMIFGQETDGWRTNNGWQGGSANHAVSSLMEMYERYFYVGRKGKGNKEKRRPFWNAKNFRFFEENLKGYISNLDEPLEISFLWNNTTKIGKTSRGASTPAIRKLEKKYFNVIESEIQILRPDIIIFACGSSRDKHIEESFGSKNVKIVNPWLSFEGSERLFEVKNLISRVVFHKYPSIVAVRVDHPNRRTISNVLILETIQDLWKHRLPALSYSPVLEP